MTRPGPGRTAPILPSVTRVGADPVAPSIGAGPQRRQTHGPDRSHAIRAPDLRPDQQPNPARSSAPIIVRAVFITPSDPPARTLSP
jgi:hypothetical protein